MASIGYAANLTQLYSDRPWAERVRLVAEAGFKAIEILWPQRQDLDELASLLRAYDQRLILIDGEVDDGYPRGTLCAPEAEERFWFRFDEALAIARRFGVRRLNFLAGRRDPTYSYEEQWDSAVTRLRRAAPRAAEHGMTLLIEALNDRESPNENYFITRSTEGIELADAVGEPNVRFQVDFYHMQVMQGDLITTFQEIAAKVGHVQVADAPGRLTPGFGEINIPNVVKAVEATTFRGYIGLEYPNPRDGSDPFAWLPREKRGLVVDE